MESWTFNNEAGTVDLKYRDGDVVTVKRADFDRAFGTMLNSLKEEVIRDYGINK